MGSEVNAIAATALSAVAAHYRGLSVSQMTSLRARARKQGVYMRVVKNTLARKAVEGTEFANAFTYGGNYLASLPFTIFQVTVRRFFTFVIPAGR